MLNWTKIPMPAAGPIALSGYQATGAGGRYYSILKHGTRFRLAAGGGKYDQKVATLAVLKEVCEGLEVTLAEFAEVMMVDVKPAVTEGQPDPADLIHTGPELGRMTPGHPNAGMGPTDAEADEYDRIAGEVGSVPMTPEQLADTILAGGPDGPVMLVAPEGGAAADFCLDPVAPPEPDLDTVVPEFRPGQPPVPVQPPAPEPDDHPDRETPLAPPDLTPDLGDPGARLVDHLAFVPTIDRLVMYRDISWRPRAVKAPVRRFARR